MARSVYGALIGGPWDDLAPLIPVADPEEDPRVPWIPPFRLNLACKNRILSNLPEVQQSLPAATLVLSV